MNANARKARATRRQMAAETHATRRATRNAATGLASAKHHLVAAGVALGTADRFASAFSRGMVAQGTRSVALKLRGKRTKRVDVKLYDSATFTARLATYRPKDKVAAAEFARVAV